MVKTFLKCEDGATAIEYGLIAALIAVAVIAAIQAVGETLSDTFGEIDDGLQNSASEGG